MNFSDYVVAGGWCMIVCHKKHSNEYMSSKQFHDILYDNVYRFLISFGECIHGKKNSTITKKEILSKISLIHDYPHLSDLLIFIDSGGYQVGGGFLKKDKISEYLDRYCDFIETDKEKYDMCFSLDLPVHSDGIFDSYLEMEKYNRMTYERFSSFSNDIKKKIFYIHHCNSPKVYEIFTSMMNDNMCDGYTSFSSPTGNTCISYSIPLSDVVSYCLSKGIKEIKYHFLGDCSPIAVFIYNLMTKLIKEKYGITVNITYDSATFFKAIDLGRLNRFYCDDNIFRFLSFYSSTIDLKTYNGKTLKYEIYDKINSCLEKYGVKPLDISIDSFYKNDGSFNRILGLYMYMYSCCIQKKIEELVKKEVDLAYSLYQSNEQWMFTDEVIKFLSIFYEGRVTKKIKDICNVLYPAIKVLERLDRDYNKYLVNKYSYQNNILEMM